MLIIKLSNPLITDWLFVKFFVLKWSVRPRVRASYFTIIMKDTDDNIYSPATGRQIKQKLLNTEPKKQLTRK